MIGKLIGSYRIVKEIGSGASATVYLVEHKSISRKVAVKILHPHLATKSENIERFRREAEALSSLDHINIVKIYDFAANINNAHIIFEFIEGITLKEFILNNKEYPIELSVSIMLQLCSGVKSAHDLGIIHRDIKPENILITNDGVVKLTDFGIARLLKMDNMTLTGVLVGSPNFMSPEQVECLDVGRSSDLFSLGVIFYYLLTDKLPFDGASQAKVIKNIIDVDPVSPDAVNRRVNKIASSIVLKCLNKDAEKRFTDVESLMPELGTLKKAFGLKEPVTELCKFMVDSSAWQNEFSSRLKKSLLEFAQKEFSIGHKLHALSCLNHLLFLDSNNKNGLDLYRRAVASKGKKRLFGLFALVVLFLLLGSIFLSKDIDEVVPIKYKRSEIEPIKIEPIKVDKNRDSVKKSVKIVKKPKREKIIKPPKKVMTKKSEIKDNLNYGKFKFFTKPWAKLYVDGEYRGKTPFIGELLLKKGVHKIEFMNPYCTTLVDSIKISADSIILKRYNLKLKEK